jgi:hypothetical protein
MAARARASPDVVRHAFTPTTRAGEASKNRIDAVCFAIHLLFHYRNMHAKNPAARVAGLVVSKAWGTPDGRWLHLYTLRVCKKWHRKTKIRRQGGGPVRYQQIRSTDLERNSVKLAAAILTDSTDSAWALKLPTTLPRSTVPLRLISCSDASIS